MKKINVAPENPQYRIVEIFESLQGEGWNTGVCRVRPLGQMQPRLRLV